MTELSLDTISAETLNSNFTKIQNVVNGKAELNGDNTQKFNVADAVASTEAVNKEQLDNAINDVNSTIADLETEIEDELATKLDVSDNTVTKQGNTFNGTNQLVQLNSNGQLPAIDGSLLTGISITVPANTTIYVATTGSDATGNGSNSAPFATIQRAFDSLNGRILLGAVTIQVADGTYSHTAAIGLNHPQSKLITLQGNTTTPIACVLSFIGVSGIYLVNQYLTIDGFKILGDGTTSTYGLMASALSYIQIGSSMIVDNFNVNIGSFDGSIIRILSGFISQNSVFALAIAQACSHIYGVSCTLTGNSSSKSTYGVACSYNSDINISSSTISNCVTGSFAEYSSTINDTGATYTNCTTNRYPVSNTLGNYNAYIAT